MTVIISADWISWMKELDGSEHWRKPLYDLCSERSIDVSDDGNVFRLSGNFEAIKDVRKALQVEAKQGLERMKKNDGIMGNECSGLNEKLEQMKIAGPEETENRENTAQKRVRILKAKPESSENEKPGDVFRSDRIGSDNNNIRDSGINLIQMKNQSTESKIFYENSLPTYSPLDFGHMSGHKVSIQQHRYLSQDQGKVTDQGQMEQHSYTSQGQREVTNYQGSIYQLRSPSHGQEQATGHQGPIQQSSSSYQGQGAGHQGRIEEHCPPSLGQGTSLEGPVPLHSYQSPGQGIGHQGPVLQSSYPSPVQRTGLQGQPSYPSLGQGTGHQGSVLQPSYPSPGHQGIIEPITNPVIPGQSQFFHQNLPPLMNRQFCISCFATDSLYFTSNRAYNILRIFVHEGDIVDQRTQVLISSANCQLTTHGSVSEAILRAAGKSIVDECSQIISAHGFLQVGGVVQTKAGNLGPFVETILHAIIPTPQQFQVDQQGAFNLLLQVFCNALFMSAGQAKSVSFPAIGSGRPIENLCHINSSSFVVACPLA